IVGNRLAFINMTRGFLVGELPLPQMQEQIVLEVLENQVPDEDLVTGLETLAQSGYRIALEDFIYTPKFDRLLEIAQFVKLDVSVLSQTDLVTHVNLLHKYNVKLLAEKVETHEEFEYCKSLGFDYFQGFFFSKPQVVVGKRVEGDRFIVLRFIAKLQEPEVSIDELENLISHDASLVYHLLRYMNSAFYSLRTKIESIKHALTLLGTDEVKKLASLMLMLRLSDKKPKDLMLTGMMRGKMAELIGRADPHTKPDQYFIVGLFSILDVLLDMPLDEVLESLPLAEESRVALLSYSGRMGEVLQCIQYYEQANWDVLMDRIDHAAYQKAYLQAIKWATEMSSSLN
ncbi:MAG: HDOD domain-containing protein, partial [Gammaproteobacteria bacterium]|nr:HDOD domain-containing protein [Gammaproteobacteria bacterium]